MYTDLYPLAVDRTRERLHRAAHRRQRLPEPRPPGRWRHRAARLLIAAAARLADEPVIVLPRRTRRRRPRLAGRA